MSKIEDVLDFSPVEAKSKITNRYECPTKLWDKFTKSQQRLYNDVREQSQQEFIVPNEKEIDVKVWDVITHNFAVTAALNLRTKKQDLALWNYLVKKLKSLDDNNLTAREIFNRVS
jgi:hypothetical protein